MARCRLMTLIRLAGLAFALGLASAQAATLDGITVIQLADGDAAKVIHGASTGNDRYLVIYVSGAGSYASLGSRDKRHCIAWAKDGSYTGSSIVLGSPATTASIRTAYPYVCQPFEVSIEGEGEVRIRAENPVGRGSPLDSGAQVVRYSRRHPVLARAPLLAVDWSLPIFRTFALHDVPLGPWPAVTAALAPGARMSLSPLKVTHAGARKDFVVDQAPSGQWSSRRVMGDVLAAEWVGWPWDALFGARLVERFERKSTVAAFDEVIRERYGDASLVEQQRGSAHRDLYWLFDLSGRQVAAGESASGSCLGTKDLWDLRTPLSRIDEDVGPWNCALIVHLRHDAGARGTVSGYQLEAVHGYATALNHFTWRVEQAQALRDEISGIGARDVEL